MIKQIGEGFLLTSKDASMVLRVNPLKKLTLEYFGAALDDKLTDLSPLFRGYGTGPGTQTTYDEKLDPTLSLDYLPLEVSTPYKGDYQDPSLILRNEEGQVFDFIYQKAEILKQVQPIQGLPSPDDGEEELLVTLKDEAMKVEIELHYVTYKDTSSFTKYLVVKNLNSKPLSILKAASGLINIPNKDFEMVSYFGNWAGEFQEDVSSLGHFRHTIESTTGSSSARHNPFFYLKAKETGLNHGEVYSFNLVYSGSWQASVERTYNNNVRIQHGINPLGFYEVLKKGENFTTPAMLTSYSHEGINGITKENHFFVSSHIVNKNFKGLPMAIDYNSWEGCGCKFNESKVHSLMKKASQLGIELFVLDDGWFGKRNDDRSSLGDWFVDKKKLPHGLIGLSDYCHKLGMKFGVWFEPEMISPVSELYQAHPDWAIQDGKHNPSLGRHQLTLDLSKKEVQDFIVETMNRCLKENGIDMVKWDYNRNISDIPNDPGYMFHYMKGLYAVLERVCQDNPKVLILNCASGGNRCDLGMLHYFPLTWVSDDTDCFERARIQEGMIVGYPQCVMSNHVSAKTSNSMMRKTSLDSKFEVASIGVMGYELDLGDVSSKDIETMSAQIKTYKHFRKTFQYGEYKTHHSLFKEDIGVRQVLGEDQAVVVRTIGEAKILPPIESLECTGLDPKARYTYKVRPVKTTVLDAGGLVNAVSPIHVKEESHLQLLLHHLIRLDGESFEGKTLGSTINNGGLPLPMQWQGTGLDKRVALYRDFSSRMFLVEKEK